MKNLLNKIIAFSTLFILLSCPSDNSISDVDEILDEYTIHIGNTEIVNEDNKVKLRFKLIGDDGIGVAGKFDSDFNLYESVSGESESLIDPTEAPRKIVPSPDSYAYATAIIMDLSGSVIDDIESIKEASKDYVENLYNSINSGILEVGVFYFDGREQLQTIIDFTVNETDVTDAIEAMDSSLQENDNTALYHGIIQGCNKINLKKNEYNTNPVLKVFSTSLVIFSDGRNSNYVGVSQNDMTNNINQTSNGTDFYCIAAGSDVNDEVVNKIGKNGVYQINDYSQLNNALQSILDVIIREANSNYELEICTAKTGTYVNCRLEVINSITIGGTSGYDSSGFSEEDICSLSQ